MDKGTDPVRQRLLSSFSAWYNADLINLSDTAGLISLANAVTCDLMRDGITASQIEACIAGILETWVPASKTDFISHTTVDWMENDATEALLKAILLAIVVDARPRSANEAHEPDKP